MAKTGIATITCQSLNIRKGPGTNYGAIGCAYNGSEVTVTGQSGNWYQVSYKGQKGYMSASSAYSKFTSSSASSNNSSKPSNNSSSDNSSKDAKTTTVTASALNIRKGPNASSSILGTYYSGAKVTYYREVDGWLEVSYCGQKAYISKKYTVAGGGTVQKTDNKQNNSNKNNNNNNNQKSDYKPTGDAMTNKTVYGMKLSKYHEGIGDNNNNEVWRLHPTLQAKVASLNDLIAKEKIPFKLFEGMRSPERQEACKRRGASKLGAWAGRHNYGLAVDYVGYPGKWSWDMTKDQWNQLGKLGKSVGLTWGGDWTSFCDRPHFELSNAPSTTRCREIYAKSGIEGVWSSC